MKQQSKPRTATFLEPLLQVIYAQARNRSSPSSLQQLEDNCRCHRIGRPAVHVFGDLTGIALLAPLPRHLLTFVVREGVLITKPVVKLFSRKKALTAKSRREKVHRFRHRRVKFAKSEPSLCSICR
jgi:hypothetical protein